MSEDQANQAQQVKPQTNTRRTEAQAPASGASIDSAFAEMSQNTRHIAKQTDKIAEHLLDGQSTPRRQAAR
jgi:predicted  nucleic acid-binding Zn-ribbon protein